MAVTIYEAIAREAHAGQKRWGGEDYADTHLRAVACAVAGLGLTYEAVAWLHDVLEDCPGWTVTRLAERGVEPSILASLLTLTHRDGECYASYIERIADSHDHVAITVKLADLSHNLSTLDDKQKQRRDKYELARMYLLERSR